MVSSKTLRSLSSTHAIHASVQESASSGRPLHGPVASSAVVPTALASLFRIRWPLFLSALTVAPDPCHAATITSNLSSWLLVVAAAVVVTHHPEWPLPRQPSP